MKDRARPPFRSERSRPRAARCARCRRVRPAACGDRRGRWQNRCLRPTCGEALLGRVDGHRRELRERDLVAQPVADCGGQRISSRPFLRALVEKISPKLGAITQRMPPGSRSAHTNSSREEPQPKLRSAINICAPRVAPRFRTKSSRSSHRACSAILEPDAAPVRCATGPS